MPQNCPETLGSGPVRKVRTLGMSFYHPQHVEETRDSVVFTSGAAEHQQVPNAPNFEHIVGLVQTKPLLCRSDWRDGSEMRVDLYGSVGCMWTRRGRKPEQAKFRGLSRAVNPSNVVFPSVRDFSRFGSVDASGV